jgi:hypothetical protein
MRTNFSQWRTPERISPLKLSALLEFIQPAQGAKDLLAHLFTLARTVDNLQILMGADALDSEKHRGSLPLQSKATERKFKQHKIENYSISWHYIFESSNKNRPPSRSST